VTGVRYTYFVKVAPKIEEIRTHRKHLPLLPLLRERKRLRNSVGRRPAFRNPQAETADERNQRDRLDVRIRRLDGTLQDRQGKYRKYADQLPRQHEQVIEANRDLIRDAQQQLEDLQQQQAECMKQLDAMHDSDADLARLVELQRTQGRLLAKIEATKTQIQELRAKTVEAEAAIEGAAAKAAELRGDVAELEQHRQVLLRQRRELTQTIRSAQDQEDLTSIVIRIHKRLAQAVSVFVFVLVGIPLGIVASRRSVMVAFGISFAIVLMVFYPFLILGQIAAEAGSVPAFPGMWVGNGLTFLIGLALMARVMSR
jgi:hypothetical protein